MWLRACTPSRRNYRPVPVSKNYQQEEEEEEENILKQEGRGPPLAGAQDLPVRIQREIIWVLLLWAAWQATVWNSRGARHPSLTSLFPELSPAGSTVPKSTLRFFT